MTRIVATMSDRYAQDSGHWYTKTGQPMYEIVGANGKLRSTTLRDARKLDLIPSVSTILKLEAKPQLTAWLVKQGMLSCLTLPRLEGEDDTRFIERALADSKEQVHKAADRGTYLHGLMESYFKRDTIACTADDFPWVLPAIQWIEEKFPGYSWDPESSFSWQINGLWYGGKRDLIGTHPEKPPLVLDFKVKEFTRAQDSKVLAYDEHVTQLAAYGDPFEGQFIAVNLFVSRSECGHFIPVTWSQSEIDSGRRAFAALLDLWYCRKGL
jgi:hypothetical protein